MPHIKDAEKLKLEETLRIQKMGELCYAFAEGVKAEYLKEPRWGSIHNIARALFLNPYHAEWSHQIIQKYASIVTQADVKTAAFLCLLEFYRVVGGRYEDGMIEQNGNVFAGLPIPSLGDNVFVPLGKKETVLNPVQLKFQEPSVTPAVTVGGDGELTLAPVATPEAYPVEVAEVKRGRGRPKKEVA